MSQSSNPDASSKSSRRALGRGLAALIPPGGAEDNQGQTGDNVGPRLIPVEKIAPNAKQPRKHFDPEALDELAASMEAQGVLQPILVRRQSEGYELIAGERRWRAAARAGLQQIPAIVKDTSDADTLQLALIENLQRRDLDPLEEAQAYHRLLRDHGLTHDDLARSVGKSRAAITNSLRLLKLPNDMVELLGEGRLTAGHARALMTLEDPSAMQQLGTQIAERGLSVRDAERQARELRKEKTKRKQKKSEGSASAAERNVEERLQKALGTKVRLRHRQGKGRIEIAFHSLDELDRLLDKLLA